MKIVGCDKPYLVKNEHGMGYIVECKKTITIPKLLRVFAPIVIFVMRIFYDYVTVEKENK